MTKEFMQERINHLAKHTALFVDHQKQEDLDAILMNAMMITDIKVKLGL